MPTQCTIQCSSLADLELAFGPDNILVQITKDGLPHLTTLDECTKPENVYVFANKKWRRVAFAIT